MTKWKGRGKGEGGRGELGPRGPPWPGPPPWGHSRAKWPTSLLQSQHPYSLPPPTSHHTAPHPHSQSRLTRNPGLPRRPPFLYPPHYKATARLAASQSQSVSHAHSQEREKKGVRVVAGWRTWLHLIPSVALSESMSLVCPFGRRKVVSGVWLGSGRCARRSSGPCNSRIRFPRRPSASPRLSFTASF